MSAPAPVILNYYDIISKGRKKPQKQYANYDSYRISVPNRFLIIGASGSGKTNILLNLILGMSAWPRIILLVKMPDEPLYQYLIEQIREVEDKLDRDILTVSDTIDDLPDITSFDQRVNTLLIFDDMIGESLKDMKKIEAFWTRGRKYGVSTAWLTQSYYATPKKIRQNSEIIIFKLLTLRDLRLVLKEYSLDKDVDELLEMYRSCNASLITEFFLIDKTPGQDKELMFRHNFTGIE